MTRSEHNWNERLWKQTQQRLKTAERLGPESFLTLCSALVSEWCCDCQQVTEFLQWVVAQEHLQPQLLDAWTTQSAFPTQEVVHGESPDERKEHAMHSEEQRLSMIRCPLPPSLHPYVEAIARFGRKQGGAAIELGMQLAEAQRVCVETAYRFADFLDYVKRNYGLSRSTCYLYMKYHEWGLPKELGSAVMKWIVQGFAQGSAEAQLVIEAAVSEGLTLAALSSRFGTLRDRMSPLSVRENSTGKSWRA